MKTLVRKEYATVCNLYQVTITEDYVKEINRLVGQNYIYDAELPEITEQDIIDAWNYDETEKLQSVNAIGWDRNGENYMYRSPVSLFDIVRDLLSDDVWCAYQEEVDYNTEDFEDYIDEDEE